MWHFSEAFCRILRYHANVNVRYRDENKTEKVCGKDSPDEMFLGVLLLYKELEEANSIIAIKVDFGDYLCVIFVAIIVGKHTPDHFQNHVPAEAGFLDPPIVRPNDWQVVVLIGGSHKQLQSLRKFNSVEEEVFKWTDKR